jgi:hypothetical protein
MKESIERLKTCCQIFSQAKTSYYSFYKEMWETKYREAIEYYTPLQTLHLFAENNLILSLAMLVVKHDKERHSIYKIINLLHQDALITKSTSDELLRNFQVDESIVHRIQNFRDKYIAHQDVVNKPPEYLGFQEYEKLLKTIENTLVQIQHRVEVQFPVDVIIYRIENKTMMTNLDDYRKLIHFRIQPFLALLNEVNSIDN